MKVRISFLIDYDDPESKADYDELITEITKWCNNAEIPQTEYIWWNTIDELTIKSNYKDKS